MNGPRKVHIKSFGCQMNVYDSYRMADTLAPEGLRRDRGARGRRPRHPQYLPHSREGRRQGLFRAWPLACAQAGGSARRPPRRGRGRRLCRAGRGPGDHPPRQRGRCCGRPAELSPSARPPGARRNRREGDRHRISARRQVRQPRGAEPSGDPRARRLGFRHRAGRLRQVLHVLRRALYARRRNHRARSPASSPKWNGLPRRACAKSR